MSNSESGSNLYPTPKTQELSMLARKIQQGDNIYVQDEIRKNPRLLASSTDVPTILQEGFRYNALHVAARHGNSDAVRIVLAAVNGLSFMKSICPDDPQRIRNERTKYLTDMYLNTPDKGTLETPLHFACKFNFYEVAKVLIGHPLCDLRLKNRDSKTAEEVIGSRASKGAEEIAKIIKLFHDSWIVPIWRDLTNDSAPIVGRPVNPKYLGPYTPKAFIAPYGDIVLDHFGPTDMSCIPRSSFGNRREIRAYAGPMDYETASNFYSTLKGTSTVIYTSTPDDILESSSAGQENSMAHNMNLPNTPTRNLKRRSFHITPTRPLTCSTNTPEQRAREDLCTPPRISRRARHSMGLLSPAEFHYTPKTLSLLLSPTGCSTPSHILEDRKIRLKDPEKGLERVARKYAAELDVPWIEYWTFLGEFVNLSSEMGLVLLEDHLYRAQELQLEAQRKSGKISPENKFTPITTICNNMMNLTLGSTVAPKKDAAEFGDWRIRLSSSQQTFQRKDDWLSRLSKENMLIHRVSGDSDLTNIKKGAKVEIRRLFPKLDETWSSADTSNGSLNVSSEGSDTDESVYNTPHSSISSLLQSDSEADYQDCDTYALYLNGTQPSKEDYHASLAVSEVIDNLSETKYPHLIGWYNSLKAAANPKRDG